MTKPLWLVASDFSKEAAVVVEKALEELVAHNGTLLLLHVFHATAAPASLTSAGELSQSLLNNAELHVSEIKTELQKRFPAVAIETIVREGDALDEIIGVATERKVDRIVVGTHGRRGMGRVLMGSIAERVVRLSPVSVLVIKTHAT